jgi:hypothetical protein
VKKEQILMISTRWVVLAGVLLLALVAGGRAAERTKKAEAPTASLQPRGTWWETMLASREGLADQEAAAERRVEADRLADPVLRQCQPFHIELNTQQEPRKIKVRIAGLERLYLGSAGQVDVFLGEPKLIARDGKSVPLSLAKAPPPHPLRLVPPQRSAQRLGTDRLGTAKVRCRFHHGKLGDEHRVGRPE